MDFGATQCTPRNPQCKECPFNTTCYALNNQLTDTLPIKLKKTELKHRYFHFTVYLSDNKTIIEKRTGTDIWRNLYQFPLVETNSDTHDNTASYQIREVLSHQIIHANFYLKTVKKLPQITANQMIINFEDIYHHPMPKIMTEFLKLLEK